jgi:hypothetical protein
MWVGLIALLSGCASITRGTTDQFQINSNPSGATARTTIGHVCVTPCSLQVNRKDEFSVTISRAGFHSTEVVVQTRVGGQGAAGLAGNVLVGGVVGLAVDASTGAALEHVPNPVAVTLVRMKPGEPHRTIKIEPPPPPPPPNEGPYKTGTQ